PLKTCEGKLEHGSILNGNIRQRRVSSQWQSTSRPSRGDFRYSEGYDLKKVAPILDEILGKH
ncbi:hypothetical protein, partial [Allorhizobium borbori]|uniref:hypothetical protein n=1 Tax=Allorhizobium borbori TaxID=485907 RepID=UPI001AED93AE